MKRNPKKRKLVLISKTWLNTVNLKMKDHLILNLKVNIRRRIKIIVMKPNKIFS